LYRPKHTEGVCQYLQYESCSCGSFKQVGVSLHKAKQGSALGIAEDTDAVVTEPVVTTVVGAAVVGAAVVADAAVYPIAVKVRKRTRFMKKLRTKTEVSGT
jgi:hypothetical protein